MQKSRKTIVIIDDNVPFLEVLAENLREFYAVKSFSDPKEAQEFLIHFACDAVILDLHLGETSGFEVYSDIKEHRPSLPIIFLSGDDSRENIIKCFVLGGDDYLIKPVNIEELVARLNHRMKNFDHQVNTLELDGLVVDLNQQRVLVETREVFLTPKEYRLLVFFLQNSNRVIGREEIMMQVWGNVHIEKNNLDTHIFNLRKKLKPLPSLIRSVKGRGFLLAKK